MNILEIKNLFASVDGKKILNGVNLKIKNGDILAILGPNGHGKSTLFHVVMGNPRFKVTKGEILFNGKNINKLGPDERSKLGLFLGMQNPVEVPGVVTADFLKTSINAHNSTPISVVKLFQNLKNAYGELGLDIDMSNRNLNEGFSGGEKKKNEIVQMKLLKPKLAMLDEIDSGLDVDAIKIVSKAINAEKTNDNALLLISHYARLFNLVKPNRAIILVNGKIIYDGSADIIKKVDKEGYEWIEKEMGISIIKEEPKKVISLGTCAVKKK